MAGATPRRPSAKSCRSPAPSLEVGPGALGQAAVPTVYLCSLTGPFTSPPHPREVLTPGLLDIEQAFRWICPLPAPEAPGVKMKTG